MTYKTKIKEAVNDLYYDYNIILNVHSNQTAPKWKYFSHSLFTVTIWLPQFFLFCVQISCTLQQNEIITLETYILPQ